jgi:hypothetical protein
VNTNSSLTSRQGLGGFAALIGGAAMVSAVALPWLAYPSLGNTMRGWDTYALASGGARWFTQHAFNADGLSPGFTGLSVLIAGGLLVVSGLAMLILLRGGAFRLRAATILVLRVLALLVFVVGGTNLVSAYTAGAFALVTPQWGLFQVAAGAMTGLVAVWVGLSRGRT